MKVPGLTPRRKPARKRGGKKSVRIPVGKILFDLLLCFLAFTIIPVLVFRIVNPPTTPLLWIRWAENGYSEQYPRSFTAWRSIETISPHLIRAVVAAEDQKFYRHKGFDWQAVKAAVKTNIMTDRTLGASTVSMQTARNVFLWQDRTLVRKTLEAYFTVLIEVFWSKERIMEVYLNVIEWGEGLFGCERAARVYFNKSCRKLSPVEAARMTAILPNPREWRVRDPQPHVRDREARILDAMNQAPVSAGFVP